MRNAILKRYWLRIDEQCNSMENFYHPLLTEFNRIILSGLSKFKVTLVITGLIPGPLWHYIIIKCVCVCVCVFVCACVVILIHGLNRFPCVKCFNIWRF